MHKKKLLGVFAYLLFLFAVVEIALQVFYYATAGDFLFRRVALPIYQGEKFAGFMNRPGLSFDHHTNEFRAHYFINKAGFRVPRPGLEYSIKRPAGTYRIMLLGPSFAYGWGVEYEKSFAALLPRLLAERGFAPGRKIELIDAGVPAMYAAPQRNWYEHVGKLYQPDLVIQFVYGSMAVSSSTVVRFTVDADGNLTERGLTAAQRWRQRAKQLATIFYGWMIWTEIDARLNADSRSGAVMGAGRELHQASGFDPAKPEERDAISFYEHLAKTVRESGARLKIVYFPLSYGVHPQDESRWRHLGLKDVQAQRAYDAAFIDYLNRRDIPGVDISGDLRAAARDGKRLYYWLDIHWTPEGNAAAAQAAAKALTAP
ncbi:hypothetical protein AYO42_03195 [Rhizomicrobium sp. SCGC AG-212-E05]|nr:hypothetical protein AYO42_03195 [Rhizomicrobium sp. SCGC AG-212-E05]